MDEAIQGRGRAHRRADPSLHGPLMKPGLCCCLPPTHVPAPLISIIHTLCPSVRPPTLIPISSLWHPILTMHSSHSPQSEARLPPLVVTLFSCCSRLLVRPAVESSASPQTGLKFNRRWCSDARLPSTGILALPRPRACAAETEPHCCAVAVKLNYWSFSVQHNFFRWFKTFFSPIVESVILSHTVSGGKSPTEGKESLKAAWILSWLFMYDFFFFGFCFHHQTAHATVSWSQHPYGPGRVNAASGSMWHRRVMENTDFKSGAINQLRYCLLEINELLDA